MLIRVHMLTDEEEDTIFELARDAFANGADPRTENDWGERFTAFHAGPRRTHGDRIIRQRFARIRKRHPVCTNRAEPTSDDGLPLTRTATTWHVGHLDRLRRKRSGDRGSHEGPGLPVSECPADWRRIAGLGKPLWTLSRRNGAYLGTAEKDGLVRRGALWRVTTRDEDNDPVCYTFRSRGEAEQEWQDSEIDGIEEVDGCLPTEKNRGRWASPPRHRADRT